MIKEIKILSIEKKKNKYQVEVLLDEKLEKHNFSEETIIKYLIFKDKTFTDKEFETILNEEKLNVLFNKALKYLSYQSRSKEEMEKYLKEKEASVSQITTIIDKLTNLGYINDEDYINYCFDYVTRNLKGPEILAQKLKLKGIEEKLINDILKKYDEDLEREIALEVIQKQQTKNISLPKRKQKMNLYQKLLRDGFHNEIINSLINKIEFVDESDETLDNEIRKFRNKYNDISDYEVRTKLISKLLNKGYEYSQIISALNKDE